MKKILLLIACSVAVLCGAAEYLFPQPIPVWVESTTFATQIMADGVTVDNCSLLRIKDGPLTARATLSVRQGSNTYQRIVTANQTQVGAVIGTNRTAELVTALDEIFAALLAAEASQ